MDARVFRTWCHSVALSSLPSAAISAFLSYTILVACFAVLMVPQHGYAASPLPGQVTFGFGGSDQEVTESVDTLFPLYAPKDSLFFFNPKLTVSDYLDPRVSVGLGYRQLFEGPQIILGGDLLYLNFCKVYNDLANQTRFWRVIVNVWSYLDANNY